MLNRFFHPLIPASALGRDQPVLAQLNGQRLALFRDATGAAAAVDDACPHRSAPLSMGSVRQGRITCAYHGWNFDSQGCGQSPAQPALRKCDTVSYQVVERWGTLWLAARDVPITAFPALGWDEFRFAGSFHRDIDAPLHVVLDNFSEDEHFPTVHSLLGWDAAGQGALEFSADNFDDRSEVHYRGPQRPHWALPILAVKAGDRYFNDWVTRFDPVHAVFSFHWEAPGTGERRPFQVTTGIFLVPQDAERTRLFAFIFLRIDPDSLLRLSYPLVRRIALYLGKREIEADARICAHVRTPRSLQGLRLGKFDKPVIHNRKLLEQLYFNAPLLRVAELPIPGAHSPR
jgi:phenylpropionate dioxygenase-like ring-hydroxylating dioxygenase large terminal subunit